MADQAQNRTLPATERKIRKARTEGQVARSRDLGHLAALGGGAALLLAFAPRVVGWMGERLQAALRFDAVALASPSSMIEALLHSGTSLMLAVLPLGAALALLSVAAGVASGGWNFTWKALEPKLQKLDPIAGIGRLFSLQSLTQTLKSCLLALVLGGIGALYVHQRLPAIAQLMAMPLPTALAAAGNVLWGGVALLLLALALFALVDVPLQREMLLRRLRMSHEELKKEQKDVEGNVEIKSKIRARMREMANRRMIAAVPGADLVVMNPSHYAVALKYDDKTMAAPRVVAKGKDLIALKIRDAAQGAKVPVLQAPPLARALYAHTEVDQEIPAALFGAVAQVLAWVYQLRAALAAGRPMTAELPELNVPPELDPANADATKRQEPDQ
jgi:flagellar biosynthetic protein FlhB